jgi:hypothetical protein
LLRIDRSFRGKARRFECSASDLGGCVDLRPVPCVKNMKGSVPDLGPHVVGDGDMKVRVGLPPDEQEGNVGAPELDRAVLAATSSVNW